jgi:2-methylcitrate dehydratase PrpD
MVDAEFSVPHAVAMTILDRPRPDWCQAVNRTDPAVLALMDKVELETDPAAQTTWVTLRHSARIPATVTIEAPRGRLEHTRRHARGGPDDPMTDEQIAQKYRELAEPVVGSTGTARIRERIGELETLDTVARLTAALAPGGGET